MKHECVADDGHSWTPPLQLWGATCGWNFMDLGDMSKNRSSGLRRSGSITATPLHGSRWIVVAVTEAQIACARLESSILRCSRFPKPLILLHGITTP